LTDFTKKLESRGIGDVRQEFFGFYEGLARAQAPFDVIDEEGFDRLSRYKLLILPNSACFSEEKIHIIKEYVRKGGNLVASFETSLYDKTGKNLNAFQLDEIFGIRFEGKIFGPMEWDYIYPLVNNGPILSGITKKHIPAPTYGIKVALTTGEPLISYYEKLTGRYEHTPVVSSLPFMVMNKFGKGKAVYFAGTFGNALSKFRFPEYFNLVRNISAHLAKSLVTIEGAPYVEVNLRRKEDNVFLHLINHTAGLKRPLTSLQPLTDLKINISGMKIKEAKAIRLNKALKVKGAEYVTLPRLEDYEIISLWKGKEDGKNN
ncbi:MAG: beta-galactosidase trimerization domain-containing protein, partial [Candidatus Omnitrophica bacterium]|nr:beta-galactosidase trimerization domain-containing protein [Candidatus Omnitrophota bacterium]